VGFGSSYKSLSLDGKAMNGPTHVNCWPSRTGVGTASLVPDCIQIQSPSVEACTYYLLACSALECCPDA